jgi:Pyridoxamine 5'-phosphate oxidase
MYETNDDLTTLQELLDASYARSGEHLRSIWGADSRLDARRLCEELVGVQVLDLGTVTDRGEPRVSPVDGLFFRGHLWFGSADNSARFRNIRANPAVSGAITRGLETFLVIVHGRAIETDPRGPDAAGFADYAREVYDFDWDAIHPTAPYARIDARTLLAFKRPEPPAG